MDVVSLISMLAVKLVMNFNRNPIMAKEQNTQTLLIYPGRYKFPHTYTHTPTHRHRYMLKVKTKNLPKELLAL